MNDSVNEMQTKEHILRKTFKAPKKSDIDLKIKIASNKNELEQAFKLLHDSYVSSGFMQQNKLKMRQTPYHLLPTTSTIVAMIEDKVVGTLSTIQNTKFGLPLFKGFDLSNFITPHRRAVEYSALAVHPEFRSGRGRVIWPLFHYSRLYVQHFLNAQDILQCCNPSHISFYKALLGFEVFDVKPLNSYDFVNGAPAVSARLNLVTLSQCLTQLYKNAPSERSLHNYFFTKEPSTSVRFPERPIWRTFDPVLTPDLASDIFDPDLLDIKSLSDAELVSLASYYQNPDMLKLLGEWAGRSIVELKNKKLSHRQVFNVSIPAKFNPILKVSSHDASINGLLTQISETHATMVIDRSDVWLDIGELTFIGHDGRDIRLVVKRQSKSRDAVIDFKIEKVESTHTNLTDWYDLLNFCQNAVDYPSLQWIRQNRHRLAS